jgi:membrane protease YdiL (CAAX protease family)
MNAEKQIRRDIRGVCLCVAAFIVTMSLVGSAVVFCAVLAEVMSRPEIVAAVMEHSLNWLDYVEGDFLDQAIASAGQYMGLASVIGMLLGLPFFFIIRGKKFVTSDPIKRNATPTLGIIVALFAVILGIQGFMILVQLLFEPLLNQGGGSLTETLEQSTTGLASSFWGVLYIVLIGPLCEELVFRGAVLRHLEKHGANFAIITSALLFGLYHIILFQAFFAFFIGVVLAYTAGRFSLKWSLLLHILNNGLAVAMLYLNNDVVNVVVTALFFMGLVATVVLVLVRQDLFKTQRSAGAPVVANTFAMAYASPWMILYVGFSLVGGFTLLGFG